MDINNLPIINAYKPAFGKPGAQQGVVLIVGLIMLLLLTLIGTTGMQMTSLEEKMAGNMRDRNLAFQAAESALAAGEYYLQNVSPFPSTFCSKSNGRYDHTNAPCSTIADPIWENINWDTESVAYTGTLSSLSANPHYIIEDMGCASPTTCPGPHSYRITAQATGGSIDTMVILQEIFQL
jgi:type IV pilus assembly protein PilX